MQLERDLRELASHVEWPPTPELRLELAPPRRSRRRLLVVALAGVVVAVAAALAVPQSRGAILRFLHLGGVTIERVETLPSAQERPLGSGLGPVVARADAERALGRRLLLPQGLRRVPPVHLAGGIVSLLLADRGAPLLLSELGSGDPYLLKKVAATQTRIASVHEQGISGLWLSGREHVLLFPDAPPRLAGNVLVWQRNGLTLRLEGRTLTRARALALARTFGFR